jgi:hypothetical protein
MEEPKSASHEDAVRQRGAREYFSHRGEYRNPYTVGSADYNSYERGWMQSLKRNEGNLVNLVNLVNPASPPSVSRPTPPPSEYNAYAELKGRSRPRK